MTLFLIGLAVGLIAHWVYRRVGRSLLGQQKWRERALAKIDHDEFLILNESMHAEYRRRFGGAA